MVGATALSLEGLVAVDPDVVRLRRGDLNALSELITRYQNRLYRYLLRVVRQPAEAEDLFQQTWLRVVEKIRSFDANRNFDAWLFTLARNLAIDHLQEPQPAPPVFSRSRRAPRTCATVHSCRPAMHGRAAPGPCPARPGLLGAGLDGRLDVLVDVEEVAGVVPGLDPGEPVVVVAVGGHDRVAALTHHEVDIATTGRGRVSASQ